MTSRRVSSVASFNPATNEMDIWAPTQAPFFVRKEIAHVLGLERDQVRVRSVVIGGVRGGAASARAANATSHASGVPQVAEVCEGQSSTKLNAANNKVVKAGRRVIVSPANGAAARVAP